MLIVMEFEAVERPPAVTMVDPLVLRNADLPEVAARLVRLMPGASRVRIFDDGADAPSADTGARPAITGAG
ncbi:hypothetical protein FRAHR75_90049 [Frankia sp. Hr75.2]|nr:hypothetical protein FRAHR75_90049 [Frankia sp. Hr75.2]